MKNSKIALTTVDNPYNPFTHFSEWFMFDIEKGHNTCGLLGRLVRTSDSLTDEENDQEMERAIDDIVKHDPLGIYKKLLNKNNKYKQI